MRIIQALAGSALCILVVASTASAEVQLSIHDGRVTLVATNVTVRQILTEWARVGQTKIVNVERIPGGPLTLQFANVPEREALDILLRSVTGYMAAPRPVQVSNLSRYDRILVLPTAAVARVATAAPAASALQRPFVPATAANDDNDDQPSVVQSPRGPLFPTFQLTQPPVPQPGGVSATPGTFPQQPAAVAPNGTVIEQPNGQPIFVTPFGAPPAAPAGGPVGTPRPGMVVQPPVPPGFQPVPPTNK
jgi:hypothetical protein